MKIVLYDVDKAKVAGSNPARPTMCKLEITCCGCSVRECLKH